MYYQKFQPHPMLRPFVQFYWTISDPDRHLSGPEHGVIPGGYVDIIFNIGDRIYLSDSGDMFTEKAKSFVAGPFDHFQRFRAEKKVDYLGVRFHPGGTPFFSALPVSEVRNRALPLECLWADQRVSAEIRALEGRLTQVAGIAERVSCVEQFLLTFIRHWKAPDLVVGEALGLIESSKGQVPVEVLASTLGISTRQLERKFTGQVGLSPKTFCRLTRFHQLKSLLESAGNLSVCDLAYACGYYDQTHLIDEFRLFTGRTPARYESVRPVGFFLYDKQPSC